VKAVMLVVFYFVFFAVLHDQDAVIITAQTQPVVMLLHRLGHRMVV
jgi:hypothetical protein